MKFPSALFETTKNGVFFTFFVRFLTTPTKLYSLRATHLHTFELIFSMCFCFLNFVFFFSSFFSHFEEKTSNVCILVSFHFCHRCSSDSYLIGTLALFAFGIWTTKIRHSLTLLLLYSFIIPLHNWFIVPTSTSCWFYAMDGKNVNTSFQFWLSNDFKIFEIRIFKLVLSALLFFSLSKNRAICFALFFFRLTTLFHAIPCNAKQCFVWSSNTTWICYRI